MSVKASTVGSWVKSETFSRGDRPRAGDNGNRLPPPHNAFRPVFTEKKKGATPLNWRLAFRVLMRGIGIASFVMVVLGLMSGRIRSYIPVLIDRQVAHAWPFTYAVVGDSLAAGCP